MEDVRAVLDAVGSRKTALLGAQQGCGMACLFAATYPERTTALVLFQPASQGAADLDEAQEWERALAETRERWGTQEFSDELLAEVARRWPRTRTTAPVRELGARRRQPRSSLCAESHLLRDGSARHPAGHPRPHTPALPRRSPGE
jgi:pimeloyl-ACP methyl ester carboxylesterase